MSTYYFSIKVVQYSSYIFLIDLYSMQVITPLRGMVLQEKEAQKD